MQYIVHVAIDDEVHDAWLAWMLDHHIPEVVATGCFAEALACRDEARDVPGRRAYAFTYRALDSAAWERYAAEHAPALQRDHTERFEGRFTASRELLPIVRRY